MGKRKTFELPGLDHGATPIPLASQVGNVFRTSGVMGRDPATGVLAEDGATQVAQVFANVEALLRVAGLGLERIVFLEVLLADDALRGEINKHWLAWFPDPGDRPARHTTVRALPPGFLVQLLVEAVAGDA
ncbi:RidA family protein [Dactylosporangium sp. CA-092794]|uniref:RidA family protein n=1 Tax=Dactylosporangium sp. CA-092794 TaxID=3239929 RepID=UPI003D8F68BB